MDWIKYFFETLKTAATNNPLEAGTLFFLALSTVGGIFWYFKRTKVTVEHKFPDGLPGTQLQPQGLREAPQSFPPAQPEMKFTPEQYRADLKARENELRTELAAAHADEKALLQAQIDELTRQQNDPEEAFEAFKTRIAELEALLGNAETADEQAAKAALEAGDLLEADAIFARISAAQALNIKKPLTPNMRAAKLQNNKSAGAMRLAISPAPVNSIQISKPCVSIGTFCGRWGFTEMRSMSVKGSKKQPLQNSAKEPTSTP